LMVGVILASLMFLFREKFWWAIAFLLIGFFIKWFSIFLVPVYFLYRRNQVSQDQWKQDIKFGNILTLGSLAVVTTALFALAGEGSLYPYLLHTQRGIEYGSVFSPVFAWFLAHLSPIAYQYTRDTTAAVLSTLQLGLPMCMLIFTERFARFIKTREDVLRWSLIVIAVFLLFTKFYSPQFVLWFFPLALLFSKTWKDVLLLGIFDVVHYISFPLVFDGFGEASNMYAVTALVRGLLLAVLMYRLVKPLSIRWFSPMLHNA
ncbi:MAG: hypothetical protein V1685_04340, partial [Parcubacteria group bacterium]